MKWVSGVSSRVSRGVSRVKLGQWASSGVSGVKLGQRGVKWGVRRGVEHQEGSALWCAKRGQRSQAYQGRRGMMLPLLRHHSPAGMRTLPLPIPAITLPTLRRERAVLPSPLKSSIQADGLKSALALPPLYHKPPVVIAQCPCLPPPLPTCRKERDALAAAAASEPRALAATSGGSRSVRFSS